MSYKTDYKEKIKQLEKENKELKIESEYYKGECNSFWADLRKRQKFNLEIAQKIVKTDKKAIANIILNMYFGKMPSDSCGFCEIFDLKGKGCCKEGLRCTDCIDDFLKKNYAVRIINKITNQMERRKESIFKEFVLSERDQKVKDIAIASINEIDGMVGMMQSELKSAKRKAARNQDD
ncbi:MAG: hypothetical protein HFH41_03985 [Lachnospiraceae bacterium]|nr:hypothetical protein [Lachnospiraceae bacterium]